jgi:hypothetical protein
MNSRKANLTDHDTFSQLVSMAADDADIDTNTPEYRKALKVATVFEKEVEKGLNLWVPKHLDVFDPSIRSIGDFSGRDVVTTLMHARNDEAPYLYFMELEGHGVGTWDGSWGKYFTDDRAIKELSNFMKKHLSRIYGQLQGAIYEAADASRLDRDGEDDDDFFGGGRFASRGSRGSSRKAALSLGLSKAEMVKLIYSGGGRGENFNDENLARTRLEQADLEGASFENADLTGANLFSANLEGATLIDTLLMKANLVLAQLKRANLKRAQLRGADLTDANLTGANLAGADLRGANLTDANLKGAILTAVGYDSKTVWPQGFMPPGEKDGDDSSWRFASQGGRKAALAEDTTAPVIGDILVSYSGYDNNKVDFHEVVGVSSSMITIRQIDKKVVREDNMGNQTVMPVAGRYLGAPMKKRSSPLLKGYMVKINSLTSAYLWTGKPESERPARWDY